MAEIYRINAAPTLFTQGEYAGKLKTVVFTAVSDNDSRQWFAKNCGQFATEFAKVMPREMAGELVSALERGDEVEFPGTYRADQFENGFLFQWSPIYLALPPIYFSRLSEI